MYREVRGCYDFCIPNFVVILRGLFQVVYHVGEVDGSYDADKSNEEGYFLVCFHFILHITTVLQICSWITNVAIAFFAVGVRPLNELLNIKSTFRLIKTLGVPYFCDACKVEKVVRAFFDILWYLRVTTIIKWVFVVFLKHHIALLVISMLRRHHSRIHNRRQFTLGAFEILFAF